MLETILKEGNKFSEDDIETLSKHLFDLFYIELRPNSTIKQEDAMYKSKFLKSYLELFNKILSKKSATDANKVELIKIISKLKLQQEILELVGSTSKLNVPESIRETALRIGKKSQSSLRD